MTDRQQSLEQRISELEKQLDGGRRANRTSIRKRSKSQPLGLPLFDVAIGPDAETGELRGHARGWIAIGDVATGVFALGGLAQGVIAVGGLSWGLVGVGGCTLGLLAAVGGVAAGCFALGGVAVGLWSMGGVAIDVFSVAASPGNGPSPPSTP